MPLNGCPSLKMPEFKDEGAAGQGAILKNTRIQGRRGRELGKKNVSERSDLKIFY